MQLVGRLLEVVQQLGQALGVGIVYHSVVPREFWNTMITTIASWDVQTNIGNTVSAYIRDWLWETQGYGWKYNWDGQLEVK